jgi:hypothetical protein
MLEAICLYQLLSTHWNSFFPNSDCAVERISTYRPTIRLRQTLRRSGAWSLFAVNTLGCRQPVPVPLKEVGLMLLSFLPFLLLFELGMLLASIQFHMACPFQGISCLKSGLLSDGCCISITGLVVNRQKILFINRQNFGCDCCKEWSP